jgi:hypothetical protein
MLNKKNLIASAVLALGVSAAVPSLASADWRRDDYRRDGDWRVREDIRRDQWAHDHRYIDDDFDRNISLREVPRNVLDTAEYERHGLRIESIQFVHRNGNFFYRFRLDGPGRRDRDINLRISPGGKLMSVEEAGRIDPWDRR